MQVNHNSAERAYTGGKNHSVHLERWHHTMNPRNFIISLPVEYYGSAKKMRNCTSSLGKQKNYEMKSSRKKGSYKKFTERAY